MDKGAGGEGPCKSFEKFSSSSATLLDSQARPLVLMPKTKARACKSFEKLSWATLLHEID